MGEVIEKYEGDDKKKAKARKKFKKMINETMTNFFPN